ncbi:MAG: hypothetical protein E5W15_12590 [Mesorhizobium sp.]|nr:MAG: hypothetical protein E5W15_12590 [Mesorhizobium sp.]TIW15665.1 MAG: hypothetical protein E5V81_24200 [Mesorhizobium sp.]TIX33623.1 MAG: hypothetical protein E5V37_03010 [Mesorhizobium sp.]
MNGEYSSIAGTALAAVLQHLDESAFRGWRSIHSDGDHPYMKAWWVPGLQIGYEQTFVHQVALAGLRYRREVPDLRDGLAAVAVVEAVLRSAKSRR